MECNGLFLDFFERVEHDCKHYPKETIAFAVGVIFLLAGVVGHYTGLNSIATAMITAVSAPLIGGSMIAVSSKSLHRREIQKDLIQNPLYSKYEADPTDEDFSFLNDLELEKEAHLLTNEEIEELVRTPDLSFDSESEAHELSDDEINALFESGSNSNMPASRDVLLPANLSTGQ